MLKLHIGLFLLLCMSCQIPRETTKSSTSTTDMTPTDDGKIEFQFLHINDTYEINPLEGGKVGGFARVATVRENLRQQNPNTLTVHAGDFLNPSLIGTIKHQGKRVKGQQMVEIMNEIVDIAAFGNHEFDLSEADLQSRLDESNFVWLGTNVLHQVDDLPRPFHKNQNGKKDYCPETFIWEIKDADGTSAKIGIFGATLPVTDKDYLYNEDYYDEAIKTYLELSCQTDVVVGLTHLERIQDLKLASMLPNVPLLMGGHDHDNMLDTIGNVVLAKADANVKSAYIHRFQLNKKTGEIQLKSELKKITNQIEDHPKVATIVQKWNNIVQDKIGEIIDKPNEVIFFADPPLDGLERHIRHQPTNLSQIVTRAMTNATLKAEGSLMNSGGIRIDDQLSGDITSMDIFRALPYGGKIFLVEIKGSLLKKVLDIGIINKGTGGYLQVDHIEKVDENWQINNKTIEDNKVYKLAVNDFLMSGRETRLDFLTPNHPDIINVEEPTAGDQLDIRKAVVTYLKNSQR